jgi:hypothetical protein
MNKAAGTGRENGFVRRCAVIVGCCAAAVPAWSQDAATPLQAAVAEAREPSSVRVEVNASSLPRLESHDTGFKAPRVDLSVLPPSRSAVGVAVGMSGFAPPSPNLPLGLNAPRPTLDLGVHWRHTLDSNQQIDVTAWRRVNTEPDAYTLIQQRQPVYGARVEMNLGKSRKSNFLAEKGFIGMQLQSGARISIKRKHGGPMIYYRSTF